MATRTSKKSGRTMTGRRRDPVSRKTPRLQIGFSTDKRGRPIAYYWSGRGYPGNFAQGRWIRLPLLEAQNLVAQDEADRVVYVSKAEDLVYFQSHFKNGPAKDRTQNDPTRKSRDFTPPRKRSRSERTDHRRQWVATFQELWSRHGGAPLLGERQWKEPLALYKQGQSPYSAYQTIVKKHFPGGRFTEDNRGRIARKKRRDPSKVANLGAFREKKQAQRRAVLSREQQEYENREIDRFLNELRQVERAPLAERKEDAQTFTEILHSNPEFVAEAVGDILGGNYGRGAYTKAQQVAHSPRMNQAAALVQWAAALNWRVPQKMAILAWKTLSQAQRKQLDTLVKREIKANLEA